MAGRLYNRQGQSLSQPMVNAQVQNATIQPVLDVIGQNALRVAQENKQIGDSLALNDALDSAYAQAPNSPEQFSKLADSAINKWAENLNPRQRLELQGKFALQKQKYMIQVGENYKAQLNKQFKENLSAKMAQLDSDAGTGQVMIWQGMANKDTTVRDIGLKLFNNAQNNTNALMESKDVNGDYVYTEQQKKQIKSNSQDVMFQAFRQAVDGLGYDSLVEFDENIFMNKERIQKETGMTDDTYDKASTYLKNRRKSLDADDKRQVLAQNYFTAMNHAIGGDTESINQMRKDGLIDKQTAKSMIDVIENPQSDWAGKNVYALESALLYAKDVTNNFTLNDNPDDIKQAWENIGGSYARFAKDNGIDQQQQQEFIDIMSRSMSDSMFRDIIKPCFDDTRFGGTIRDMATGFVSGTIKGAKTLNPNMALASGVAGMWVNSGQKFGASESDKRYSQEVAHEYLRNAMIAGMAGDYSSAEKILKDANKAVIIASNNSTVGNTEFERLERALQDGKPALWTHPATGETFKFLGFSNVDAVFDIYNGSK